MKKFLWPLAIFTVGVLALCSCTTMGETTESPITTSLAGVIAENITPASTPIENAAFTTKYDEALKNRTTNLELATKTINGTVVNPDEVFSFNETIGKPTLARGYKIAKIFVKGKEEKGIGGGICQVSSTLYNAADFGGLEIVERHAHSKRVYYVDEGRDAAASYGGIDLKFRNTLSLPVKIVANAVDGELTVTLEAILS